MLYVCAHLRPFSELHTCDMCTLLHAFYISITRRRGEGGRGRPHLKDLEMCEEQEGVEHSWDVTFKEEERAGEVGKSCTVKGLV